MKRLFSLIPLIFSGCSVIGSLFIGEKCDLPDQSLISCREIDDPNQGGAETIIVAEVCLGGFAVLQPCAVDQFCIADPDKTRNGAAGCGFPSSCGNGVIEVIDATLGIEEECDDGNGIDTDGCFSCKENVCGDGVVNLSDGDDPDSLSDENCEPKSSGDCNESCFLGCLEDVDCLSGLTPEEISCFSSIVCNVGVCEREVADDGNECTNELCLPGEGLISQNLNDGTPCAEGFCSDGFCRPLSCGDGNLDPGEQCDDNNNIAGDGCDANCRNENCGNGVLDAGEECDDQNNNNADFCTTDCLKARCGDGFEQPVRGETCDDGADNNTINSNCSADCQDCGDGQATGSELCDSNDLRGLSCTALNFSGGDLICASGCSDLILDGCSALGCGDGDVQAPETCDDTNIINGDGCDNNCTVTACGNGVPTAGEQCDLGAANNDNGPCTLGCTNAVCGDGFVQTNVEECDDGNQIDNDNCSNTCIPAECGDGITQIGEQCEDGNIFSGDGCSASCVTEFCGDGIQNNSNEECDDGNQTNDDTCSNTCTNNIPADRSCGRLIPTPVPTPPQGIFENTANGLNTESSGCMAGGTTERAFLLQLPAPLVGNETMTITVDPTNSTDIGFYLRIDCEGFDVTCVNNPFPGQTESLTIGSTPLANATDIFLFVETNGGSDTFTLDVTLNSGVAACGDGSLDTATEECDDGNTANNDRCSSVCQIEDNCPFNANLVLENTPANPNDTSAAPANNFTNIASCSNLNGKDLVFMIFVPPGSSGFSANLFSATDMAVAARANDCQAGVTFCSDLNGPNQTENAGVAIQGPAIGYIIVDSKNAAGQGTFTLTVNVSP